MSRHRYVQKYRFSRLPCENGQLKDEGAVPLAFDLQHYTCQNTSFRRSLWTGDYLQLTVMCIPPGGEIGLELHPDVDQLLYLEQGNGVVQMGDSPDSLTYTRVVSDGYAVLIPAGKWHNFVNNDTEPVKLFSVYGPPEHPQGTFHKTKADSDAAENEYTE